MPVAINRYIDNDILCVIAAKTDRSREIPWQGDDPEAVAGFFTRWHAETREHYAHL